MEQKQFSSDSERSLPPVLYRNGTIWRKCTDDDLWYDIYYRFENGELKPRISLSTDYDYNEYFRFDPDFKKRISITKEEYDRTCKEFEGDGQVVALDWRPLAEYARSRKD
jgi:hypothetical protein